MLTTCGRGLKQASASIILFALVLVVMVFDIVTMTYLRRLSMKSFKLQKSVDDDQCRPMLEMEETAACH